MRNFVNFTAFRGLIYIYRELYVGFRLICCVITHLDCKTSAKTRENIKNCTLFPANSIHLCFNRNKALDMHETFLIPADYLSFSA